MSRAVSSPRRGALLPQAGLSWVPRPHDTARGGHRGALATQATFSSWLLKTAFPQEDDTHPPLQAETNSRKSWLGY